MRQLGTVRRCRACAFATTAFAASGPDPTHPQGYVFPRDWAGVTFGGSLNGIHGAHPLYDQFGALLQHVSLLHLQCGCTSGSVIFWYSLWDHPPVMGTHELTPCRRHTPDKAPPALPEMSTLGLLCSSCFPSAGSCIAGFPGPFLQAASI